MGEAKVPYLAHRNSDKHNHPYNRPRLGALVISTPAVSKEAERRILFNGMNPCSYAHEYSRCMVVVTTITHFDHSTLQF